MTSPSLGKINSLVGSLIYNPELAEKHGLFYEDLTIEQAQALNKLIWQMWRREIALEKFLAEAIKLNLPGFKEKIFPGILRYDFLPLADYLGININEWLNNFSAGEASKLKIVPFNKWLADYLKERDITLEDKLRARIVSILKNFIGGDDEEKTIKTLDQTEKLGGVGLAESEAQKLVKALKDRFEKAVEQEEIITAQEVAVERTKNKEQKTQESPKIQSSSASGGRIQSSSFVSPIQLFDQTAEDLIKQSGLPITPELRQRFKIIVISRLKDVRKIPEMREKLMADVKTGGLGLKLEEAERVVKLVEESGIRNQELGIGKRPVSVIPAEAGIQTSLPKPAPAPGLPVIQPVKKESVASPPLKKEMVPPVRASAQAIPSKISNIPEYPISPVKTSSDIKKMPPSDLKIISQAKTPPKVELAPPRPLAPRPISVSAIPQALSGRAKVEDVAFKPRLVGPVEELKGLSLVDFRRLSPKPQVTTDKIYAKIELLAEEGYDKKVMGIKAWQASPVNALYGAILNEGMEKAKPVAEIIASHQSAGQETLTPEEFKTVMELNKKLR